MTSHQPETPPDVPGYEITRLIGLGGMAEVYLAHQQVLNRSVAIKFLSRSAMNLAVEAEQRFRREAELMARISHPNVATIFDFGTANGRPYLVMEYVPTGDLRSRMIPGSAMGVDQVRGILGPVILAVEHLHHQGIVHRDIKPENILMHQGDVPKVADFGIAVIDSGFGTLTRTGMALGTPGYVAPEQHYRLEVDERVDQFSLAAMAYELVTGRRPLGAFQAPSKLNRKVGREAEAAILKGLSDDRSDRYATIGEFGDALLKGLSSTRQGQFFPGRSGWLVAGNLIGISLLGVGVLMLADRGYPVAPRDSAGSPPLVLKEACPPPTAGSPPSIEARAANLKLIRIPPGEFLMGSPETDTAALREEKPRHLVKLTRGFYLGETEVTVKQFRAFVGATKYRTTAEKNGGGWVYNQKLKGPEQKPGWSWRNPAGLGPTLDDEPVVQVSWIDAMAFCDWLTRVDGRPFRLPTEAEWEYACRAGTQTRWSFGDTSELLDSFAWNLRNAQSACQPVKSLKPNAFGLHDMHGNVWEWCLETLRPYSEATVIDPKGSNQGSIKVLRGGSFDWHKVEYTRSATRIWLAMDRCYFNYGFRVCSTMSD